MSDNSRGHGKRFRAGHNSKKGQGGRDRGGRSGDQQSALPRISISQDFVCPKCGQNITDLASSLADRQTGQPVHFDCVLQTLQGAEELKQNEKITYIGQGRFAVVYFENPHDTRHFSIVRIIEWEEREKKFEWRGEIAGKFSQIK